MRARLFRSQLRWLLAVLALALGTPRLLWAAPVPYVSALAVELQPLRGAGDRPEWFASPLKPVLVAYNKGQWSKACVLSAARYQMLLQEASRLFFGMERKKADTEAIERYLDAYVRGSRPELELAAEGFAPAVAWRSLAVDACVRADKPAEALRMIGLIASLAGDGPAAVAVAVARAQTQRDWLAAAAEVARHRDSLRVALIRALAYPEQAKHWLAVAEKHVQLGSERELLLAVRKAAGQP